ncbi:carboxylesterase family protein, partial [Streptomyces sp. NPDC058461]
LKIPATAEAFAAVDRALLLRTQAETGRLSSPVLGGPTFGIVIDGDLVPRDPLQALVDGDAAPGAELLLGWTREEYRLWLVPGGLLERVDRLGAVALAGAMARCHCGHEVPRGYRALHPGAGAAETVGQMVTDHILRRPLQRLADARPGTAYVYEFAWPSGRPGMGACHGLELGFVFGTGDAPEAAKLAGDDAPQDLADAMHGAWVRFAATGDPGWEPWDERHPVRVFGAAEEEAARAAGAEGSAGSGAPADGTAYTAYGPRDRELALWAGADAPADPPSAVTLDPDDPDAAPLTSPPGAEEHSPRTAELRSVVSRLRRRTAGRAGGVGRN